MTMTNNKSYIVSALYEWIVDNNCTPHVLIDSTWPTIILPQHFANEDKIVLNISPAAIRNLNITLEEISFTASFDNEVHSIVIPVGATLAIYAQENGQGMVFDEEPHPKTAQAEPGTASDKQATKIAPVSVSNPNKKPDKTSRKKKPVFKVIK
ncbi:MAG: ClpXP protease specificity-enhancing factor [Endozoicomonadaceae bacterium]|nr:ClpXP protease specificity-enhancing factor [Endozoicomonadaceae bacterium]